VEGRLGKVWTPTHAVGACSPCKDSSSPCHTLVHGAVLIGYHLLMSLSSCFACTKLEGVLLREGVVVVASSVADVVGAVGVAVAVAGCVAVPAVAEAPVAAAFVAAVAAAAVDEEVVVVVEIAALTESAVVVVVALPTLDEIGVMDVIAVGRQSIASVADTVLGLGMNDVMAAFVTMEFANWSDSPSLSQPRNAIGCSVLPTHWTRF